MHYVINIVNSHLLQLNALEIAYQRGYTDSVRVLLRSTKVPPIIRNCESVSPLQNYENTYPLQEPPFHAACLAGDEETVAVLLKDSRVDPNEPKDNCGVRQNAFT